MEKFSQYLKFVNYNDKIILFNLMSGAILSINKESYADFLVCNNNVDQLLEKNSDLYSVLIKTRSIIDASVNEIDIIRYRNKRDVFLNKKLHLTINTTMDCNFKCWYCYEKCITDSRINEETKDAIIRYFELKVKNREINGVALNWFGGEPLLYFNEVIYPISLAIKKLCSKNNLSYSNAITTNGYLVNPQMIDRLNEIYLTSYHVTLDGNEKDHNKTRILKNGAPTYRKIVDNLNLICENVIDSSVRLRINYKNDVIDGIKDIADDFKPENRGKLEVSLHRIWQTKDKGEAKVDEKSLKDWFRKEGFISTTDNYYNLHRGNTCYAGKYNQLVINYDGNIFKCTAQDFKKEDILGYLENNGEIKWDTEKIVPWFAQASFENEICLNCQLLPLCLGLCPYKYVTYKKNNKLEQILKDCPMKKDSDFSLDDYIITRYEELKAKNSKNNV